MRVPAALLAAAVLLAGCLNEEAPAEDEAEQTAAPDAPTDEAPVDTGDPEDPLGTGDRAHKHDYWGGKTEQVLADVTLTPTQECGYLSLDNPENGARGGCAFLLFGNGSTVLQGTNRLTLTVSWSDPLVTGVGMMYRDAQAFHNTFTELANGVAHEIPVTLETADMPHTSESKWAFEFYGGGGPSTGNLGGPLHVLVTVYRGLDLPIDPPHPDFWGENLVLDLGTAVGTLQPTKGQFAVFFAPTFPDVRLPEGSIVPPGTMRLDVNYTWQVRNPDPGWQYSVHPFWKSAASPEYHSIDAETEGGGTFSVDVTPEMVDSPYATTSQWAFALFQDQYEPLTGLPSPLSLFGTSPLNKEMDYTLHVVAHRSPEGHDMG